jgi:hypothetical protein
MKENEISTIKYRRDKGGYTPRKLPKTQTLIYSKGAGE